MMIRLSEELSSSMALQRFILSLIALCMAMTAKIVMNIIIRRGCFQTCLLTWIINT
jgi:hypothetical protein